MKYIIPQEKLNKIVFRYLDNKLLNKLEKYKAKYYDGIVYKLPNEEFGLLGWKKPDTLYVYYELIDEISDFFSLDSVDSEEIIGKWAEDRLQIEVKKTQNFWRWLGKCAEDRLQIE